MATNFNENSIVSSGGFKPSSKDTPLDIRTRVETERDIYEIPNPYIGMIVYVKDTGKRFEILTLKEVDTGLTIKNVVDTYKQFTVDLEEYAKIEDVPTKVSELENDRGYAIEKNVDSKIEAINNTLNSNTNTINSNINTINSNINTINTEIDNINTDLTNASESIEGSWISVVSKDGYLKDIEILGNTIQNQNDLADIRSVGDKLENQELYEIPVLSAGKNLYNESKMVLGMIGQSTGEIRYEEKTYLSYEYYIPVKPNTTYVINKPNIINMMFYYDKDKKYISSESINISQTSFITPSNCKFIRFRIASTVLPKEFQLEEGTVATPYEPYQEDKLTILSPVQLEKVGDVADRIICKDGIWGVEKNIGTTVFDGSERWRYHSTIDNTSFFQLSISSSIYRLPKNDNTKANILSNRFLNTVPNIGYNNDIEGIYLDTRTNLSVRVLNTKLNTQDLAGFKSWLSENSILLKYQLTQPTFIPLPNDQQIKLRTFANKTNISFGCEIEPTLKASVPKSIGASVNSHAEQIDNLSKELEKINNLEESTVSTVTSESNFTTVENTNNGYFDDVKLKGKTLVNKFVKKAKMPSTVTENGNELVTNTSAIQTVTDLIKFNSDKITFIYEIKGNETITVTDQVLYFRITKNGGSTIAGFKGELTTSYRQVVQVIDVDKESEYVVELRNPCSVKNIMVLEGDHTQNPPEYFEGLKSVGQDVDEITIATTNAPMFFGKGGKK